MPNEKDEGKMTIFIAGHPETKGSTKAFRCGNRCIITNANPRCKKWQAKVSRAVAHVDKIEGAVELEMTFFFPIAKSRKDLKDGDCHTQKSDIDKLIRPILDGLTSIVYKDDCQVSKVTACKKWTNEIGREGVELKIIS